MSVQKRRLRDLQNNPASDSLELTALSGEKLKEVEEALVDSLRAGQSLDDLGSREANFEAWGLCRERWQKLEEVRKEQQRRKIIEAGGTAFIVGDLLHTGDVAVMGEDGGLRWAPLPYDPSTTWKPRTHYAVGDTVLIDGEEWRCHSPGISGDCRYGGLIPRRCSWVEGDWESTVIWMRSTPQQNEAPTPQNEKPPVRCECGGDRIGGGHSDWCPKGEL